MITPTNTSTLTRNRMLTGPLSKIVSELVVEVVDEMVKAGYAEEETSGAIQDYLVANLGAGGGAKAGGRAGA
eukprot:8130536-Pyramimonas_sp.AAC.1